MFILLVWRGKNEFWLGESGKPFGEDAIGWGHWRKDTVLIGWKWVGQEGKKLEAKSLN